MRPHHDHFQRQGGKLWRCQWTELKSVTYLSLSLRGHSRVLMPHRAGRLGSCLCRAGGCIVPSLSDNPAGQPDQTDRSFLSIREPEVQNETRDEDHLNNYLTDQGCCHGKPCHGNKNQTYWKTLRSEEPWGWHLSDLPEKGGQEIHLLDASLQLKASGTHSL